MQQPDVLLRRMLIEGVPVTLLLDLLCPPDTGEVYAVEGGSADWLEEVVGAA